MPSDPGAPLSERVPPAELEAFARRALIAVGLPESDAAKVAHLMVEADLIGADGHGIFRLPQYVRRIEGGGVEREPVITINRTATSTAIVDGGNGMGHLVVARAAETAIELAKEAGIGWVGIRNSNHAGPASLYAAMPVAHGMVGIYGAVASANHMAPWGGTDLLLGTNPLAIGVPAGNAPPVILDIATTVVSYGTIKTHALKKQSMPDGWMIDRKTGDPINDPSQSADGVLLPIGGYKGAGLSLMLGLLAGTLNGAAVGKAVVDFNADNSSAANTGQFIVALDVARFIDPSVFASAIVAHLDELRASARLPGVEEITLPGDGRTRRRSERSVRGIPIGQELRSVLDTLGLRLGVGGL